MLDPGDEVVIPWPSFPSFVRDAQKRDAVPVLVPLVEGAVEIEALRAAVTPRTRLLFLATPNNPTGLEVPRDDAIALVRDLPEHVLAVVDEAYFDYLEPGSGLDTIADLAGTGETAMALSTFSKLYGLAGLRVGYGVGPAAVVAAMRKVQRGYDVGALAQVAALASLGDEDEAATPPGAEPPRDGGARRDRGRARARAARRQRDELRPRRRRSSDADEAAAALLRHGVAVQSGAPFGAPTSLRIGAGSPAELERLDAALRAAGLSRS